MAMYAAKRDRRGFAQYAPEHDGFSPERLALVGDLRAAIDNGELVLYFQPQIDLRSGDVKGCEALVRWVHPQRGLIPPDEFIPLAEHTGLIKPLTRWVLDAALRECRGWLNAGWDLNVSVNASCATWTIRPSPTWSRGCSTSTRCQPAASASRSLRAR